MNDIVDIKLKKETIKRIAQWKYDLEARSYDEIINYFIDFCEEHRDC